uniref:FP17780 n=1 Tax=Homo sapiens TaxID=9606 RepID=Q6XYE3_HUMAN|nr:FP17780 [Homo sapiens]
MGEQADGKDSIARQVAPESHWPELRVLILVVSAEKKLTGSTVGMRASVETSPLLRFRAESVVPRAHGGDGPLHPGARLPQLRPADHEGQQPVPRHLPRHLPRPSLTSMPSPGASSTWCTASTPTTGTPRWRTPLTRAPMP